MNFFLIIFDKTQLQKIIKNSKILLQTDKEKILNSTDFDSFKILGTN